MAKSTETKGVVRQRYSGGTGMNGKEIFKFRTINNISPQATDEAIHEMRKLMNKVLQNVTLDLVRQKHFIIEEE